MAYHPEIEPIKTALQQGDTERALREEIALLREYLDDALDQLEEACLPVYGESIPSMCMRETLEALDMVLGR